jgi:hypothetical protein
MRRKEVTVSGKDDLLVLAGVVGVGIAAILVARFGWEVLKQLGEPELKRLAQELEGDDDTKEEPEDYCGECRTDDPPRCGNCGCCTSGEGRCADSYSTGYCWTCADYYGYV